MEKSTPPLKYLALKGARVLVAEDNRVNQIVIQKQLEKFGAYVDIVENGLLAVQAFKKASYDLILMDYQMPEMDGCHAAQEIRKYDENPESTPIIAMTANALIKGGSVCKSSNMDDFILKPIKLNDLYEKLRFWYSRKGNPLLPVQ